MVKPRRDNPRVSLTTASPPSAFLLKRARVPDPAELADIPWLQGLEANEKERALSDLKVVKVEPGELLCRVGRPVTYCSASSTAC